MRKGQPCGHLQPDYNRLEDAFYITVNPDTGEISWPPTRMMDQLRELGLVSDQSYHTTGSPVERESE